MAVAVFARYPGLSPETYDEVVASLDLDANPPAGAILHLVGEGDGALLISEIWRTEQTFQAFHDFRLVPALQMHGFANSPEVEITPLHNLFAVEMETIERMGAVSLPAHLRGCGALGRRTPLSAGLNPRRRRPLDPTGVLDRDHNAQRDAELLSLGRTTGSIAASCAARLAEASLASPVTVFLTSTGRVYSRHERRRPPARYAEHVFDALANRLQDALGDLGRRSRLDEETVTRATREIRLALLEADVDFEVVKQFVSSVRERALGQEVLKGLEPGQQVVKIVHEELTELMGSADSKLAFGRPPTVVLLCGLQGSGQDDRRREARAPPPQARAQVAGSRRGRSPAARRDRPARAARTAASGARLPHGHDRRGRRRAGGARAGDGRGLRRRDRRHRRSPPDRRGADGRARAACATPSSRSTCSSSSTR